MRAVVRGCGLLEPVRTTGRCCDELDTPPTGVPGMAEAGSIAGTEAATTGNSRLRMHEYQYFAYE